MNKCWKKYLFWFAHNHVDFRIAEMKSILNMYNINMRTVTRHEEYPYWIVELSSRKDALVIANRAISLKHCIELWAHGNSREELDCNLKKIPVENIKSKESFKIKIETFCKHFTQREKVEKIENFSYLPLEGPVQLNNPEIVLYYIEFYGLEPNDVPSEPYALFFGRWIQDGRRDLIRKLSLKNRKFIGNTSMDPQLSLIMANQAQVREGDLVLDPFVGTGSLLVAASQFGGFTLGTDIDFLMLHGRTKPTRINQKVREKDENVAANMRQYGTMSYHLDVVVSDFSVPMWREDMLLDAIITDPPYGIRESTERIGPIKSTTNEDKQQSVHYPTKITYDLSLIFADLLRFSARHLKPNGRLVCWFPVLRDRYTDDQLPAHPCFQLIANSEQVLSNYTSRRLLTYEKTKEPNANDRATSLELIDFREQYFSLRDESRKIRRLKEAEERAKKREDWETRNNVKIDF